MRYLILIAVMLIPAWGWADEYNVTRCVIADNWESPVHEIPCDEKQQKPTCEQRMREAMMDIGEHMTFAFTEDSKSIRGTTGRLSTETVNRWHQTMKDCVEGR